MSKSCSPVIIRFYSYQKAWLKDKSRFKIGMFSRQSGKTFTTCAEIVDDCIEHEIAGKRTRWVILSRGERQAKEAMDEAIKPMIRAWYVLYHDQLAQMGDPAFEEYDYRATREDGTDAVYRALEVVFPNGSRITALPANPDTARGFSANVMLDEFAFHQKSREIWRALFPVISAGYKLRVVSTPNGKGNRFYDLITGGPGWRERGLEALDFDGKSKKMLLGLFYGYAVAEILWGYDGRFITLEDIRVRQPQRFRFGVEGDLWLIRNGFEKERMPENKFWTFVTGADDDDTPYGIGLAHWLFWPCYFKRNGLKAWLTFLDKYAMPTPVGRYDAARRDERKTYLKLLSALSHQSAVVFPKEVEVEFLEAQRRGTADYKALHETMEKAISKIVLSQTMTTDEGSSLAQGRVHGEVKEEVIKSDADLLCSSFNRDVVARLTRWNFPNAIAPKVWRRIESDPDLKEQAARDRLIHAMGYEPVQSYIDATYGEGNFVRRASPSPPTQDTPKEETTALAEAPQAIEATADQLAVLAAGPEDQMIDTLRELILDPEISSLGELSERLLALYPTLGTEDLAAVMGQALALEELKDLDDEGS